METAHRGAAVGALGARSSASLPDQLAVAHHRAGADARLAHRQRVAGWWTPTALRSRPAAGRPTTSWATAPRARPCRPSTTCATDAAAGARRRELDPHRPRGRVRLLGDLTPDAASAATAAGSCSCRSTMTTAGCSRRPGLARGLRATTRRTLRRPPTSRRRCSASASLLAEREETSRPRHAGRVQRIAAARSRTAAPPEPDRRSPRRKPRSGPSHARRPSTTHRRQ